jgi:hypothetical protein
VNAERLHAIVLALKDEMTKLGVVSKMQSLVTSLQAVVQQSNASTQQTLAGSRESLLSALSNTRSDAFSPLWRQILREIGGEDLFGKGLKTQIEASLARNQMTPAVALDELQQVLRKLQEVEKALNDTTSAFRQFRIGDEGLEAGTAEIGILVPRQAVRNELPNFADELKELGFILNTFSEVATGKTDRLEIRSISSSDLMIQLSAATPYAACLAVAVERVVTLYKQLLEIRRLHQEIQKQGVAEEDISGIERHANKLMENGIEKASAEIVNDFYAGDDKGRKNELTTAVRISMNKIANRIDHGYSVEVRVAPLQSADPRSKDEELTSAIALIESAYPNMQFLKLEGQPLLKLPESAEKVKKKEKSPVGSKKEQDEP